MQTSCGWLVVGHGIGGGLGMERGYCITCIPWEWNLFSDSQGYRPVASVLAFLQSLADASCGGLTKSYPLAVS